jgi:hypothetical protein
VLDFLGGGAGDQDVVHHLRRLVAQGTTLVVSHRRMLLLGDLLA